jgi:hypothetical protein
METSPAIQLMNDLERFCGTYNIEDRAEEFIKAFCIMHRTKQQSALKLLLKLIEFMASDNYRTDLRNEASKFIAQEIIAGFQMKNEVAMLATHYEGDQRMKFPSNHLPMI